MTTRHVFFAFLISWVLALLATPLARAMALSLKVLDHPSTPVKTHAKATPYFGGLALFVGVAGSLLCARFFINFPSGTLHALRGLLVGGFFMVLVGLVDDVRPRGLSFQWKFFFQIAGALLLILFDVRLHFIHPEWLGLVATVVWVVGITNAFNIIDIMDGLAASQACVAALGFLFIALPTEQTFVNLAAAAVAGACLGFIPFNLSTRWKIFMGDTGSLLLGFLLAAISMGISYTGANEVAVLAPFLILGLPIYDTFFVSALRVRQGKSPFLGSKDHLALKLRTLGFSSRQVVLLLSAAALAFGMAGFFVTITTFWVALGLCGGALFFGVWVLYILRHIQVP